MSRPVTSSPRWSAVWRVAASTLEQSLDLWERGERLAGICEQWLEGTRARLAAAMAARVPESADPAAPF